MHPQPLCNLYWYQNIPSLPLSLFPSLENVCLEQAVWNLVCRDVTVRLNKGVRCRRKHSLEI